MKLGLTTNDSTDEYYASAAIGTGQERAYICTHVHTLGISQLIIERYKNREMRTCKSSFWFY